MPRKKAEALLKLFLVIGISLFLAGDGIADENENQKQPPVINNENISDSAQKVIDPSGVEDADSVIVSDEPSAGDSIILDPVLYQPSGDIELLDFGRF